MKKLLFCTIIFSLIFSANVFAGKFIQVPGTIAWIYYDDPSNANSMVRNEWREVDTNGDGFAEYYFFGQDGLMYADRNTPDGYYVNKSGQWEVDGNIQLKSLTANTASAASNTYAQIDKSNPKLLINHVTKNSGVIPAGKISIGTEKWVHCLKMTPNSYIIAKTNQYNLFYTMAGLRRVADGFIGTLAVYVNGQEYDHWSDFSSPISISVHTNSDSEIMLVYTVDTALIPNDTMSLYLNEPLFGGVLN